MSTTDTRAAFEEWAESGNGSYTDAWAAWQAATEAAKPEQEGDIPPPRYSYSADGKTVTLENYDDMMEGLRRYRAEAAKATGTAGELPPKQNLTLDNAPIGTMAPSINGGAWYRAERGWKWNNGSTFPRLGGDWNGELIAPTEAARQPAPVMSDKQIDELWEEVLATNPLPQPAYRALVRAALAATNRSQP